MPVENRRVERACVSWQIDQNCSVLDDWVELAFLAAVAADIQTLTLVAGRSTAGDLGEANFLESETFCMDPTDVVVAVVVAAAVALTGVADVGPLVANEFGLFLVLAANWTTCLVGLQQNEETGKAGLAYAVEQPLHRYKMAVDFQSQHL